MNRRQLLTAPLALLPAGAALSVEAPKKELVTVKSRPDGREQVVWQEDGRWYCTPAIRPNVKVVEMPDGTLTMRVKFSKRPRAGV